MAFKNLEELYQQTMADYWRSARDESGSGEPYVEIHPDDPNASKLGQDSRSVPMESVRRDLMRMTAFSKSGRGLQFLFDQQTLQSLNTFTETRVINPLFVVGNVQPFVNIRRPLSAIDGFDVDEKFGPKVTEDKIGGAGRLQKETHKNIVARVSSGQTSFGVKDLLKVLPPTNLVKAIGGILSLGDVGTIGTNMRPELDMDGDGSGRSLYPVMLNRGFVTQQSAQDPLKRVMANLRTGNIPGAVNSLKTTSTKIAKNAVSLVNDIGRKLGIRNAASSISREFLNTLGQEDAYNTSLNGFRYFITDRDDAARYLEKSVEFNPDPIVSMGYMEREPKPIPPRNATTNIVKLVAPKSTIDIQRAASNKLQNAINGLINGASKKLKEGLGETLAKHATENISRLEDKIKSILGTGHLYSGEGGTNPAEAQMRFPQLSLRQQFLTDEKLAPTRDAIDSQTEAWLEVVKTELITNKEITTRLFDGGFAPGAIIGTDVRYESPTGKWFFDPLNNATIAIIEEDPTSVVTSAETFNALKKTNSNLIDFVIYDFVNKKSIPFRALISSLNESVSPMFSDETRYIGRVDRNVVYSGVNRELSFQLQLQAFDADEMETIYKRLNYLTGLCYPATYSDGFMVPPFVKLTLGDLYVHQPGYFKALSHTIEDDIGWETTEQFQAPMGITTNITFSIIERKQMQTDDYSYYHFGQPRHSNADLPKNTIEKIKNADLGSVVRNALPF